MELEEYSHNLRSRLDDFYGSRESAAMVRLIFAGLRGWSLTDLAVKGREQVMPALQKDVENVMTRLEQYEPIQYVLGLARFYGLDFHVDRRVLIPRPETEELVDLVIGDYGERQDCRLLDIGTGSGAIAIALARHLRFPEITALDVSEDALEVARENAERFKTRINFVRADIFDWTPESCSYDAIVSNPPYIPHKEKEGMERNVLDFEPHGALFVPDSDPLLFYRNISSVASEGLEPGGRLYLEINPLYVSGIVSLLEEDGFEGVSSVKDISKRDRFIVARKPIRPVACL